MTRGMNGVAIDTSSGASRCPRQLCLRYKYQALLMAVQHAEPDAAPQASPLWPMSYWVQSGGPYRPKCPNRQDG